MVDCWWLVGDCWIVVVGRLSMVGCGWLLPLAGCDGGWLLLLIDWWCGWSVRVRVGGRWLVVSYRLFVLGSWCFIVGLLMLAVDRSRWLLACGGGWSTDCGGLLVVGSWWWPVGGC